VSLRVRQRLPGLPELVLELALRAVPALVLDWH
jgi:hypothetical protein